MTLTLRRNKGAPLTHDEGDENFSGLADLSLTSFLQSGSGAVARTVQEKLREIEVSIVDYGATDGADIASAFNAIKTAYPNGCTIVFPETSTHWLLASQISTPDGTPYILRWRGPKSKLKKAFNGDMISLGTLSLMERPYLDGDGANFTGRGVVISTGDTDTVSWRRIYDPDIRDMQSNCIAFTAAKAGFGSQMLGGILVCTAHTTYAIDITDTAETNGNRSFVDVKAVSGALINLGGSQNTLVMGCESGSSTANPGIRFTSDTTKARVIGNRFANNALTIDGTQNVFEGNICAATAVTFASTLAGSTVTGNAWASGVTFTDNASGSVGGNWINTQQTTYTPTWTGGSPSIGDGSLSGSYVRRGHRAAVSIQLTVGSTTNVGSGAWSFSLPYTSARYAAGPAGIQDSSPAETYAGAALAVPSGSTVQVALGNTTTLLGSATPITWATGDVVVFDIEILIP